MEIIKNPFEYDCVADSYDTKSSGKTEFLKEGKFYYPKEFGSSGGKNFLRLLEKIDSRAGEIKNVLELGCGTGAFYEALKINGFNFKYTGLDYSANHIERAKRNYPDAEFYTGDASKLNFGDSHFDFVFENNLFPFLLYPLETVREMIRVSKKYVCFSCHATPIKGGLYCYQPLYTKLSVEKDPDGNPVYIFSDKIEPALRPRKFLPKLMKQLNENTMSMVIAKVKKHYADIETLKTLLASLNVEVLESNTEPSNKYPAVMNITLSQNNSLAAILNEPEDCAVTEDDVILNVSGMDAFYFLKKQ